MKAPDVVITMACGDTCRYDPGKRYDDWLLDDPAGKDIDAVRAVRDNVRNRVRAARDGDHVCDGLQVGKGDPDPAVVDACERLSISVEHQRAQVSAVTPASSKACRSGWLSPSYTWETGGSQEPTETMATVRER